MTDSFQRHILTRLPLAEAVLSLWGWLCGTEALEETYDANRGRCHTRLLRFPDFVSILFTCLSRPWKSARDGLLHARDEGRLPVSFKAFYDKLRKTPVKVSLGFFRWCSARLRQVVGKYQANCPISLRSFTTLLMDGTVVKHVQRRLKQLRYDGVNACKLLGPRSLVLADRWSGLLYDLVADLDGEANEVKYVSDMLLQLRETVTGPWLLVGDRAFGVYKVADAVLGAGGAFLFRQHGCTTFLADTRHPPERTTDRFGRTVVQEWGWILRGKRGPQQERLSVRRLTVLRARESLVLLTSLTDSLAFPADDLLDSYLARWDIEGMFQKVTEQFGLRHLFSTSPEGMLFQLVLGFLMHNVVQAVKLIVAEEAGVVDKAVSTEMLFRDVVEELISVTHLLTEPEVVALVEPFATGEEVLEHLRRLLRGCWKERWRKARHAPRDPSKPVRPKITKRRQKKSHDSVYRILNNQNQ
jgi:hypothetical protein